MIKRLKQSNKIIITDIYDGGNAFCGEVTVIEATATETLYFRTLNNDLLFFKEGCKLLFAVSRSADVELDEIIIDGNYDWQIKEYGLIKPTENNLLQA